ncbi:hypothetical protein RIF29_41152 [Crotalaria pallida]|uniref:Uncharacterized protein n=1 Tax=Crotalaria pallida TaxID=3830 RepID=A0AAN9E513_CROPI
MGISHCSHANLGSDCIIKGGAEAAEARWGESFKVLVGNYKEEDDDQTEVWFVKYKDGNERMKRQQHDCCCGMKARSHYSGEIESIDFRLEDNYDGKETRCSFELKKTSHGLRGGMIGPMKMSGDVKFYTNIKNIKKNHVAETVIFSYGGPGRRGLFVVEMKKRFNRDEAYMVTLAHYYLTKDRGLSVTAKIDRTGDIELEGPINHPSADLRKVLDKTCRTGEWSPAACLHCSEANITDSSSFPRDKRFVVNIKDSFNNFGNDNQTNFGSEVKNGDSSNNRCYNKRHNYDNHDDNSKNNRGTLYGIADPVVSYGSTDDGTPYRKTLLFAIAGIPRK